MKLALATTILCGSSLILGHAQKEELLTAASSPVEMVVTAHFSATDAGRRVLAKGGTAVDAMIAVQAVLGLVEPQSSGLGGGAFVVYYDAETKKITTFDGREMAGANATETRYQNADGTSLSFFDAWQSGLSIGVPGVPRLMEDMHNKYGTLEWADLFEDAKTLATEGFNFTARTADGATALLGINESFENPLFFRDQAAFDYFLNEDGTAKPAGTMVTNADYAATLELLASEGADVFYSGVIGEDMIAAIAADRFPTDDPPISMDDLLSYKVIEREPVCQMYRDTYNVCGMGPPSSGALAVGQILGILDNFDIGGPESDPQDPDTVHLFTQAMRLAFADRNLYVGDSDFITVPVEGMLNKTYLAERAGTIDLDADMGTALPGVPPGIFDPSAPQTTDLEGGTSHVSIVDQFGNALSMTTTIESFFGSGLLVRGFLLNNQLTDFSFQNVDGEGTPIANRVQPGKRPRSSMSPTIVLDDDEEVAILAGSPGGSRIIGYTTESLMLMMDFGFDPQEAANTPHFQNRNGPTELEPTRTGLTTEYNFTTLSDALEARNHTIQQSGGETSGLSLIMVTDDGGFLGGSDPRRDGTAGGREEIESGSATLSLFVSVALAAVALLV